MDDVSPQSRRGRFLHGSDHTASSAVCFRDPRTRPSPHSALQRDGESNGRLGGASDRASLSGKKPRRDTSCEIVMGFMDMILRLEWTLWASSKCRHRPVVLCRNVMRNALSEAFVENV